jgi:hypothetical protein
MRQMLVCDAREQTRGSSGDIIPAAFSLRWPMRSPP